MTQLNLLLIPRDTHVTAPSEQRRLSGQSARILARLQAGPAKVSELVLISIEQTQRKWDHRRSSDARKRRAELLTTHPFD